jgi:ketosteroid isomerase-like protein
MGFAPPPSVARPLPGPRLSRDNRRAMSRETVEIVRRSIDALNRRDLDAAFRYLDPEIDVDWSLFRGLEAGGYREEPAARGFWITPLEFIDAGDRVIVPNSTLLCGRDGVEAVARSAPVVTVRSGRIVAWTLYQEKADALEAVGLRE